MKITITYNNEADVGFKEGWGFSCLIEDSKKILFDTGGDFEILKYNLDKLSINPNKIDKIVISHRHWDHTGGLEGLKSKNPNIEVIWPDRRESFKITNEVYSTGALSSGIFAPPEQSLILKTNKGLVILVGCSHPGVDRIIEKTQEIFPNQKIYGIIGGFHGFNKIEKLEGIEFIGACHCTQYKDNIKKRFPEKFREVRVGDIIKLR